MSGDMIEVEDAPMRDISDVLDHIQTSDEFVKKITRVYKNIGQAAEVASEFMISAMSDPEVSTKEKIEIAQYVLNRILGAPTNRLNMRVDSRSVSTSLQIKTPAHKIGEAYRTYDTKIPEKEEPKRLENDVVIDAEILPVHEKDKEANS